MENRPNLLTRNALIGNVKKNEAKEWAKEKFRGLYFEATTPFTLDLKSINEDGLRRNLRHFIKLGANGIGWEGPYAEPFTLSIEERKRGQEILAEEARRGGVVSFASPVCDS